jgi:hypothetical protein
LQRAHLHHLPQVLLEQIQIEKAHVDSSEIETARAAQMDGRGRGGAQAAMPEAHKIHATGVPLLGCGKNLLRLHVEEAEAHRAVTHDAFQVSSSPAAAVGLFGIERDYRVTAFPHA